MEVEFLKGTRFVQLANEQIIMLQEDFDAIEWASQEWIEQLQRYVSTHRTNQLPRLQELKRYYLGDNNINYRPAKTDEYAADNRISSDFAKYITTFEQGYMLGQPVEYENADEELLTQIKEFSDQNNEEYHNVLIKKDLSIYGRAYELIMPYRQDDKSQVVVKLYKFDPEKTFVIYDDGYDKRSLMAVNYYNIDYGMGHKKSIIKVYTADAIYTYVDDNQQVAGMTLTNEEPHYLQGVPVNEYSNNEDRTGAFEAVLDNIDAYDLSQSELANFQQNSNDALLVIIGNPHTGSEEDFDEDGNLNPNGALAVTKSFKEAQIVLLDDNPNPDGAQPNAFYLVKEYDSAGAEAYKKRLVADILRFTFTPDTNDDNFAGTQSGVAMRYKLMGSENYRGMSEKLFRKGLMRRLRLAVNVWAIRGSEATNYDAINQTNIVFTPNLPANDNELIEQIKALYGIISDETLFSLLSSFTGVDAEEELKRLKAQEPEEEPQPRIVGEKDDQESQ